MIVDLWLKRINGTLVPDSAESAVEFARLPSNKPLRCEVKQPRSLQHHKLYFSIIHRIANAKGVSADVVDQMLRIASGHCDIVRTKRYGDVRLPKPLKFSKCDQLQFRAFFEAAVAAAYTEFGIDPAVFSDLLIPPEHEAQTRAA
jgi:hypothetical protein